MRFPVRVSLPLVAAAALTAGLFVVRSTASAQEAKKPEPAAAKADAKTDVVIPFFGNEVCPTSGKPVNKSKFVESNGERVYFCCGKCMKDAEKKKAESVAAAYKAPKAVGNKVCPISGHAIEAGKGKEVTWQGRTVTLCCANCVADFQKEPMLAMTKAVYGATDVANKKCPVMASKNKDEAATNDDLAVYKGKIVHFCCDDCLGDFVKTPDAFMAKLK